MELDSKLFWDRAKRAAKTLRDSAKDDTSLFSKKDSFIIWIDKNPADDVVDVEYTKVAHASMHFFNGFELPETLLAFGPNVVVISASEKKIKMLQVLKTEEAKWSRGLGEDKLSIEFVVRPKNITNEFEMAAKKIAETLKSSGSKSASIFLHEATGSSGPGFASMLATAFESASISTTSNGQAVLEELLAFKDEVALKSIKDACQASCLVQEWFRKNIPDLDEKPKSHSAVVGEAEKKLSGGDKESAGVTSVQSGARGSKSFNLSNLGSTSPVPKEKVSLDTMVFTCGSDSKGYKIAVSRTIFVDPTENQKNAYALLLKIRQAAADAAKPGATFKDVYAAALEALEGQLVVSKSDFKKFNPTLGFEIGFAFANSARPVGPSSNAVLREQSTFLLDVKLENLAVAGENGAAGAVPEDEPKLFACRLSDVVVINSEGKPEFLSDPSAKSAWSKIHFKFQDEDEVEAEEDQKKKNDAAAAAATGGPVRATRSKTKSASQLRDEEKSRSRETEMVQHQHDRMLRKAENGLAKAAGESGDEEDGEDEDANGGATSSNKEKKLAHSFNSIKEIANDLRKDRIHIDSRKETVLLPLAKRLVPFHISCLKSIAKLDEGDSSTLRLNFYFPTTGSTKDMSPEMRYAVESFPMLAYVKELSFKSRDLKMVLSTFTQIKDLQKNVRDKQKKDMEEKGVVAQAPLILLRERPKEALATLTDVSMIPTISGKGTGNCLGKLKAHVNGFRFTAEKGGEVDFLYSNVKYMFFQRGEKELKVLVHFYLRNPIIVNKKKTRNLQFFTEVQEGSSDLAGRRRQDGYDPDEIEDEERQRKLVSKLNKMFSAFCTQCLDYSQKGGHSIGDDNDVEIVNTTDTREMGFNGTAFRDMVFFQPTQHCLVNLTERDPFVLCVDEIEHIHFERMQIGISKGFDVVFVLKAQMALDGSGDHINPVKIEAIQMINFEKLREWIDQHSELTYTCGTVPLNWAEIMKEVRHELEAETFWKTSIEDDEGNVVAKDLGWKFLQVEDNDEDDGSDSKGGDSDFSSDEESSEESSDDSGSGEVSEDDDDEEDEDEDEDEDSGEDSEDLDRKAEEADRQARKREAERAAREGGPSQKRVKR